MGRRVNREFNGQFPKKRRNPPDVILVTMSDHESNQTMLVLNKPRKIGMDEISAQTIIGKCHAAVDDQDFIALFERKTIHADFTEPPEGDPSNFGARHALYIGSDAPFGHPFVAKVKAILLNHPDG
jgi:hypothetical protein